jgi:nucleoside-diphosphate-sugar epimerase
MNHKSESVLITGGAGFIGSNVVPKLLDKDYRVVVLDNLSAGRIENLKRVETHPNFAFKKGDIRNRSAIRKVMENVDVVVHLAAQIDVSTSVRDPFGTHETNVTGTLNLLQEAVECKVAKFVLASSTAVYGDTATLPLREETALKPISPYAASKAGDEAYLSAYAHCYGLETVALRFFNVYGQKNQSNAYSGVITKFLQKAEKGEPLLVEGDGEQTRDFVHVSDVANSIALALAAKVHPGEAFNICTGTPSSINVLAETVKAITGKNLPVVHGPSRVGDVRDSYGDPAKAMEQLGFRAVVDLASGLKMMVQS